MDFWILFILPPPFSLAIATEENINYLDCGETSSCTHFFVIPPQFNNVGNFNEGLAPVKVGDFWGYINTNKFFIDPQYNEARIFSEGLAAVKIGDFWGYIDKTGVPVIPPKFDGAGIFSEGLAAVKDGDKWGYIEVRVQY